MSHHRFPARRGREARARGLVYSRPRPSKARWLSTDDAPARAFSRRSRARLGVRRAARYF